MGILSNTKWVAVSQLFKIGVQLLNIVVLARLIPPSEYGLMAMALVVTNFATLVRDLGTSAAIIQRKDLSNRTINAIFWLNVSMGLGIGVMIVILSPLISFLFHEKKLISVLCLLAISFPLASSSSSHLALLERESKFRSIAFIEITSSATAVSFAIMLAYLNWGVYSLVGQAISLSAMSTIQLWKKSKWRPDLKKIFDWNEIKSLIGFSGNLTLFNFINYFSRNADSMIIGHYMSSAILGAYSLAYRVMLFPIQNLTFVITRALFPVFSSYQDDNVKLKHAYLNIIYYILLLVLPLMIGLMALNKPFVKLVFGDRWHETALILAWLAPTGIIQAVLSTSGTIFMAKAKTNILMKLGIVGAILQVGAFIIGAQYDIITFAKLYFFANVLNFFPVMLCVMSCINGSIFELFRKIIPLLICAIGLFFSITHLIVKLPYFSNIDSILKLFSISFCAGGVYVVMIALVNPKIFFRYIKKHN
ncbi:MULTISPECIES: MOP flippase family protein [Klebsiella]|uniref:MOP flippase family protein n=1 Tax=Klebsiella TaxID=570 RepID=UPI000667F174|nr:MULTISPECIES: MOP flippase family protein [Klebsiella]RFP40795.1 colanic acid exporter [Klebsiella oxytoca]MDK7031540.1 MOP flippase family protein [Klebsiella grimontii]MDM4402605.1 MOP flippase family protein [Klebsiella grimontii]QTP41868.1 MOP flippase family protein [Klebsiella grimontii]RFP46971.1 colanic acid exporter [Klebsiella oxytoca]